MNTGIADAFRSYIKSLPHNKKVTRKELREAVCISDGHLQEILYKLQLEGRIEKVGWGIYQIKKPLESV